MRILVHYKNYFIQEIVCCMLLWPTKCYILLGSSKYKQNGLPDRINTYSNGVLLHEILEPAMAIPTLIVTKILKCRFL